MSEQVENATVATRLAALLRERAEQAIHQHGLEWAAKRLDIGVTGVEAWLWRSRWDVEDAVRIADRLGVLTNADLDRLDANPATPV